MRVTLKPLSAEKTHVEYRAHFEPGGVVPAWAANKLAIDTPYKTLKQAKEVIEETKRTLVLGSIRNQS